MLSAANRSIVARDRELIGLSVLLDPAASASALSDRGLGSTGSLQIEYLRYKPGRRCISQVRFNSDSGARTYVLSAFPKLHFEKQASKLRESESAGFYRQNAELKIRIDHFPFDPALKHIAKCFDPQQRERLFRRLLGREVRCERIKLEPLAYKPSRRYVSSCTPLVQSDIPTNRAPLGTVKFYSRSQFSPTLRRLQALSGSHYRSPKVLFSNEHYGALAVEWVCGQLFSDLIEAGIADAELYFEIGCELGRLHQCPPPPGEAPAISCRQITDIANYLGYLCPELKLMADQTVATINSRLMVENQRHTLIHGDFYAKQVIVGEDSNAAAVRFIDFDQARQGNPYQDLGNFVAQLYWQEMHLNRGIAYVEQTAEPFLAGYRSIHQTYSEFSFRTHLAAGLVRCATHPFRRAKQDWLHATRELLMLAQNALHPTAAMYQSASIA